jgi:hypothetical protein
LARHPAHRYRTAHLAARIRGTASQNRFPLSESCLKLAPRTEPRGKKNARNVALEKISSRCLLLQNIFEFFLQRGD